MFKFWRIGVRFVSVLAVTASPLFASELRPFTSDGCSLFPNSSQLTRKDWCECCFFHDVTYWRGGTYEERRQADLHLKDCVLERTGDWVLANIMYEGVRFGGNPYFYNWYRWGYGWPFDRKYQVLTSVEHKQANKLLEKYFSEHDVEATCSAE